LSRNNKRKKNNERKRNIERKSAPYKRRRFDHFFNHSNLTTLTQQTMDKTIPSATSKTGGAGKKEQASVQSKDAGGCRRANIKKVQNVLLIWLDSNFDDSKEDCHNTVVQLRRVVNDIHTFGDGEQCIQFLNTIDDNKVCMIISGSLGEHIVPRVHNMSQVDSIFIFCGNKNRHEQWTKNWSKIKGVFTEITPICEALCQASQQCEQNAISISFVATSGSGTSKNLDRLDPMFMYTTIMKEIILTIKFEEKHFKQFIDYCRDAFDDNEYELKNIDKLSRKYRDETPIWWYTCECFLYPMLNRALRISDVDIIIKMGLFIGDLHRQIETLHKEQFSGQQARKTFTVYRGQGLSKTDFDQLTNMKGGLISFNNFLSTSKDRNVSLGFARKALADPDSVGILFVMTIDPSQSTTPFASINHVSFFKDKVDEVLFSMHTVFRIGSIKPMGENQRLVQMDLTLTGNSDKDLQVLIDRIRAETLPDAKGWYRLSKLLNKMGQFRKAEEVYAAMLEQSTDESEKGNIYYQLGSIKIDQGEYEEAITFYEKSLEISRKTLPSNHPDLAHSYTNIGAAYDNMGDYPKALSYYEKALEIKQKSLPPNHPDLAHSYDNIGAAYDNMGDYPKALSYYEKALEIKQKSLPPNHPDLTHSYNNIGAAYDNMGDYPKALSSYEKALEIRKQSLPSNHPDLAASYSNIGTAYDNLKDYSKARSFFERAVNIGQQSLPLNHPRLRSLKNNLENVKKKL
jgi:tetratricopeptide (TPR) repeat protein